MRASAGQPGEYPGWLAELKWDGLRGQLSTDGRSVRVRSSTGRDITVQFPELADLGRSLGAPAVLDGELVAFDDDRPSFHRVLQRLNVDRPGDRLVRSIPITYMIFDLLVLDGTPLLDLPYATRRHVLQDLFDEPGERGAAEPGPPWRVPPSLEGGAAQLLELAHQRDLEGIVVKDPASPYRPGSRTSAWRKVKIRLRQEFVVGGWLAGQGSLEDGIGSLVLGVMQGSDLVVAGLAGSGLTDAVRSHLADRLVRRADTPFAEVPTLDRQPTWVEPTLVVEAEFGDWPEGGTLRHPVFVGIRDDKDPTEVVREIEPPGGYR